jgi:cellulose synthase/poly-beta-1,6-N-acetylglucosamine synthase-like glycosyltransferase
MILILLISQPQIMKGSLIIYFLYFEKFLILYLFIANSSYLLLIIMGYLNSRKKFAESLVDLTTRLTPLRSFMPISILMPCHNEGKMISDSVKSMLRTTYSEFEIIVCNDGSTDNTMEELIKTFNLIPQKSRRPQILPCAQIKNIYISPDFPDLTVIDKKNKGKADALNASINYSKYNLVCCIDSDSLIDEKGLCRMALGFFEDPDNLIAVGGTVRIANDTKIEHGKVMATKISWNYFSLIQITEYIRAFLVGRMGWDYLKCNTIISGAFGLFKKEAVIRCGGYKVSTIGEDLELLLRMHLKYRNQNIKYDVQFLPDPICWTEVPTDFKTLGNQRSRWQQGLAEGLWSSKEMLFKPWGGRIGWIALPYLWIFELISAPLEILGYFTTFFGYFYGLLNIHLVFLFLTVSILFGWILTLGGILIEEMTFSKYPKISDFQKLFIGAILEQFGYRQLHLFWRLRGIYRAITGYQTWGSMTRKGFTQKTKDVFD